MLVSFVVEHMPKEIQSFIRNKNIKINIFRIQADKSIMCGCFCIVFYACRQKFDWLH